mmetsp:Transcript_49781/g.111917  ORF Transcript_49781/g.111917 Transcript_49781/m.111917 type:complete len:210 (-) Transcript_49781:462-1091(-)
MYTPVQSVLEWSTGKTHLGQNRRAQLAGVAPTNHFQTMRPLSPQAQRVIPLHQTRLPRSREAVAGGRRPPRTRRRPMPRGAAAVVRSSPMGRGSTRSRSDRAAAQGHEHALTTVACASWAGDRGRRTHPRTTRRAAAPVRPPPPLHPQACPTRWHGCTPRAHSTRPLCSRSLIVRSGLPARGTAWSRLASPAHAEAASGALHSSYDPDG